MYLENINDRELQIAFVQRMKVLQFPRNEWQWEEKEEVYNEENEVMYVVVVSIVCFYFYRMWNRK